MNTKSICQNEQRGSRAGSGTAPDRKSFHHECLSFSYLEMVLMPQIFQKLVNTDSVEKKEAKGEAEDKVRG